MTKEHFNLLKPILKKYRHENKDMSILVHKDRLVVRVGSNRIKYKTLKAHIVPEEHCPNEYLCTKPCVYYDFVIYSIADRVSVVNVYAATSVIMDILLDFTIALNKYYRNEEKNESI